MNNENKTTASFGPSVGIFMDSPLATNLGPWNIRYYTSFNGMIHLHATTSFAKNLWHARICNSMCPDPLSALSVSGLFLVVFGGHNFLCRFWCFLFMAVQSGELWNWNVGGIKHCISGTKIQLQPYPFLFSEEYSSKGCSTAYVHRHSSLPEISNNSRNDRIFEIVQNNSKDFKTIPKKT